MNSGALDLSKLIRRLEHKRVESRIDWVACGPQRCPTTTAQFDDAPNGIAC
jgi:hypothetical protein